MDATFASGRQCSRKAVGRDLAMLTRDKDQLGPGIELGRVALVFGNMGVTVAEDAVPRLDMRGDGQGVRGGSSGDKANLGLRGFEKVADKVGHALHRRIGAIAALIAIVCLQDRGHDFGGRTRGVVGSKTHQGVSSIR
jgi:hypothetical protein